MRTEQARSQHRHERILEAAERVFSKKGYHDTLVDDIALDSQTSKGGVYFHFPNKQSIFRALLDRMASLLRSRVEAAIAGEADPIAKADIALQVVLQTFASHRTLSRLFFVEALGAGREFNERMSDLRASFAELIQEHLDEAVRQGAIPAIDTAVASRVWFGALNEVLTHWVLAKRPARLEDAYPTVRALLLRSIGAQVPTPPEVAAPASVSPELEQPQQAEPRQVRAGGPGLEVGREDQRIRGVLEKALQRARRTSGPILASVVLPAPVGDPIAFFQRSTCVAGDRLLWMRPRAGYAMAAAGSAWTLSLKGAGRFHQAALAWHGVCAEAIIDAPPDTIGVGAVLLAGFSFDPQRPSTTLWDGYPDGRLILPRYLLTLVDGGAWLTINTLLESHSNLAEQVDQIHEASLTLQDAPIPALLPSMPREGEKGGMSIDEWKATTELLRNEIRRGSLEKVVLARDVRVCSSAPFDAGQVLRRLRAEYPSCFVFAVARDDRCFLGATPERLVRLRDGMVSTMCLAGSIARGETEAHDRRLGEELLASSKDRAEHAVVVRALREALAELCDGVAPISTPVLMKVRNVQHLLTTMVGRVADGRTILDLVERLHPTPAVGGYPRDAALELIRDRERLDRGWYGGPIGWLDARGEGEMAVAIRSALLRGSEASLFAGCGIVADSDPESEYAESCLKLRPMLSALGHKMSDQRS